MPGEDPINLHLKLDEIKLAELKKHYEQIAKETYQASSTWTTFTGSSIGSMKPSKGAEFVVDQSSLIRSLCGGYNHDEFHVAVGPESMQCLKCRRVFPAASETKAPKTNLYQRPVVYRNKKKKPKPAVQPEELEVPIEYEEFDEP